MTVLQKTSLLFIFFVVISWNIFDLSSYFNLSFIKTNIDILQNHVHESPKIVALLFFATYILIASFSLPGATILTILSGSIFSYPAAVIIVSFASSIGATCAFAISKILLKDWVQKRFSIQFQRFKHGWNKDRTYYLLSVRLTPIFPFFLINIIAGILPIGFFRFYWVSQLGMLPATLIYVNAGTELGNLREISDVMSANFLIALTLFALLPILARMLNMILLRKRTFSN